MPIGRTATIRYDTKAQLQRFKEAARRRRWSLNVFTLEACERFATQTEEEVADSRQSSSSSQEQAVAE